MKEIQSLPNQQQQQILDTIHYSSIGSLLERSISCFPIEASYLVSKDNTRGEAVTAG
jgi:hypothetical protein